MGLRKSERRTEPKNLSAYSHVGNVIKSRLLSRFIVYLCHSDNTLGKSIIYYFIPIRKQQGCFLFKKNQTKIKPHPQVMSGDV